MRQLQYAVYLIPPPELLAPIRIAQQVAGAQFGTRVATSFMVHCTVKGFFKLAETAAPEDFLPALDALYGRSRAFETELDRLFLTAPRDTGASVLMLLRNSPEFQRLHEETWAVVKPFIAEDCPFSFDEPSGPNFRPHITLLQAELPNEPGLRDDGRVLSEYLYQTLPHAPFLARTMHLVEFLSEDWRGRWWDTLRFRLLKSWTLAD